ncbi:MAG: exodeoxyribonuclease VII large subunit [Candidatus Margulisbacteria bacterium GWF2_35_9]|nr:MAG: exodeoxyribonuclease VII large subunit [Candidatus Margulisbacteria bacterium GWF2_35_9]
MTDKVFTVTEITKYLKLIVDNDEFLQNIWIKGEVSNLREYRSGNQLYFTLKDDSAQISCVIFASNRLGFDLKDNMEVITRGKLSIYEKRGVYTYQVQYIEPAGIGALAIAFEQLKRKLQDEGLFSSEYKKQIPMYPKSVGVITSPTGAALHDVVATIRGRNPSVQIFIVPTVVQGKNAAPSIVASIELSNKLGSLDVLVLARGGGSIEELWGFNEEIVARAIFNSKIPIISAVGHEVDFTISDFVADARAATPTSAGVMVSLPKEEYLQQMVSISDKLKHLLLSKVQEQNMLIADLSFSLKSSIKNIINNKKQFLIMLQSKLESLNPQLFIKKGYVMVKKSSNFVKSATQLNHSDKITLRFFDGEVDAIVI